MNKEQFQTYIENLRNEFELKIQELEKMKLEEPGFYWNGYVADELPLSDDSKYHNLKNRGEIFNTYSDCMLDNKRKCLIKSYLDTLKRINNGWTPDWTDFKQQKFSYYYSNEQDTLFYEVRYKKQCLPDSWYTESCVIYNILEFFSNEELKLIFTGKK